MKDRFYMETVKEEGPEYYRVISNHDPAWAEEFPFYEEAEGFCATANRHYFEMVESIAKIQSHLDSAIADLDGLTRGGRVTSFSTLVQSKAPWSPLKIKLHLFNWPIREFIYQPFSSGGSATSFQKLPEPPCESGKFFYVNRLPSNLFQL